MRRAAVAVAALSLLVSTRLAVPSSLDDLVRQPPSAEWRLPKRLKEISGLAMSDGNRLFAVDDEIAIVYEIDYDNGKLLKAFAFGEPALRGDFEGLALVEDRFYLLTSDGILYDAKEGHDGYHVSYNRIDTGLGRQCEFEGLSEDVTPGALLLACKALRKRADIDVLSIFRWPLGTDRSPESERIDLPIEQITEVLGTPKLRPSGIAVHPLRDTLVLVAARERALIELDANGRLLSALVLPKKNRHPQAEGIEFASNGSLILADEGQRGRATMVIYSPPE